MKNENMDPRVEPEDEEGGVFMGLEELEIL